MIRQPRTQNPRRLPPGPLKRTAIAQDLLFRTRDGFNKEAHKAIPELTACNVPLENLAPIDLDADARDLQEYRRTVDELIKEKKLESGTELADALIAYANKVEAEICEKLWGRKHKLWNEIWIVCENKLLRSGSELVVVALFEYASCLLCFASLRVESCILYKSQHHMHRIVRILSIRQDIATLLHIHTRHPIPDSRSVARQNLTSRSSGTYSKLPCRRKAIGATGSVIV